MKKILVVDDDIQGLETTRRILEFAGYSVLTAHDGQAALDLIRSKDAASIQAILTDVRMPRMSGLEFLRALSVIACRTPVILMTAFGNVEDAVWAMKLGAVDFLSKPFKKKQLLDAIELAMSRSIQPLGGEPIVRSSRMSSLREQLQKISGTQTTVLIQGESGVGKERIAREIHDASPRSRHPFIAINCAAIPENLLESELFGFERGAFSGADQSKPGLFEAAHAGTLLLDEIGDMPLVLQAKLLRVLQEGEIRRLGSTRSTKVDVRVIASTHQDLRGLAANGRFREDLLYRLEVIVLHVPALRDRPEDIVSLARHFLEQANERHGRRVAGFSEEVLEIFASHPWPGNVRELSNAVERAVVLTSGEWIQAEDLPVSLRSVIAKTSAALTSSSQESISIPLGTALKDVEALLIQKTLEATHGDKAMTARLLGITSRTIYRKLDRRDGAVEGDPESPNA